jgi:phage shock protein PspC (stress-responsive transcriptional regulator)
MRSVTDKKIAGVCAGLAKYTAMDPAIVRILWLLLTFGLPPAGVLGYIAAWIIMPVEPVPVYTAVTPTAT